MPLVRLADIGIDLERLDRYLAELKVEIAASVGSEPGVPAIYAVAEKDDPSKPHLLGIDADDAAYRAISHRRIPRDTRPRPRA